MATYTATITKVEHREGVFGRRYIAVTVRACDMETTFEIPEHRRDAYRIGRTVEVTLAITGSPKKRTNRK